MIHCNKSAKANDAGPAEYPHYVFSHHTQKLTKIDHRLKSNS